MHNAHVNLLIIQLSDILGCLLQTSSEMIETMFNKLFLIITKEYNFLQLATEDHLTNWYKDTSFKIASPITPTVC